MTWRFLEGYNQYGTLAGVIGGNGTMTNYGYDGVQRVNAYALGHGFPDWYEDNLWLLDRNSAGQLSSVTINHDAFAWTRHFGGNRAYTTNGLNQYDAAGIATLTYDKNGNMITETVPDPVTSAPVTTSYVYDVENRLVSRSGGVSLVYDPLGRLFSVASTTPSAVTTQFLYDGDALVGEYNAAGTMTARYVHRVGADVPVIAYSGSDLATRSYLHANHQGSIVAVSDGSGAHAINTYDEYGIPGAANTGRFQYTGQIWLPELGMYHYKARVYSPTLGRFLQTDPIGYQDQFNLYAYVGNDPINLFDPSGEAGWVVSRPTSFPANIFGSTHSFVAVAPSLGGPLRARFSYGPDHTSGIGGNLTSRTDTGDPTDLADRAAWQLISRYPEAASYLGINAVAIDAPDAAIIWAGTAVDQLVGTQGNPGPVRYDPLVDVYGGATTGNSNTASYAVANLAGNSNHAGYVQQSPSGSHDTGRQAYRTITSQVLQREREKTDR